MRVKQRLADLNLTLPEPVQPAANYVRFIQTGNLLFISGTGPSAEHPTGKVDTEVSIDQAYAAARSVGKESLGPKTRDKTLHIPEIARAKQEFVVELQSEAPVPVCIVLSDSSWL